VSKDAHPHPKRYQTERWHRAGSGASLRNFVFGTSDGLVTVLAFVAGVSASFASRGSVLLAGVAEMFAGALSMGMGAFLGARAERDLYRRERAREEREIREVPHLERDELREIYRQKGFEGEQLEKLVDTLTADPKRWVDVMMSEELGLQPIEDSPLRAGAVVGVSYLVAAMVPLVPYVFLPLTAALAASIALTALALGVVGVAKARFTQRSSLRGAAETIVMGLVGVGVCYGIGKLTPQVIH
jgi:vacuolar iron transporter family protein